MANQNEWDRWHLFPGADKVGLHATTNPSEGDEVDVKYESRRKSQMTDAPDNFPQIVRLIWTGSDPESLSGSDLLEWRHCDRHQAEKWRIAQAEFKAGYDAENGP